MVLFEYTIFLFYLIRCDIVSRLLHTLVNIYFTLLGITYLYYFTYFNMTESELVFRSFIKIQTRANLFI